jgi:hypothetical protein
MEQGEDTFDALFNTIKVNSWAGSSGQSQHANERGEIVAKLIGKAFETALLRDRSVMINYLLGSAGVLSLATIANDVFLAHRLDGAMLADLPLRRTRRHHAD